jgi:hypothetical protein
LVACTPQFTHPNNPHAVIPGRPEGSDPESRCMHGVQLWIPGSRPIGAPRNDKKKNISGRGGKIKTRRGLDADGYMNIILAVLLVDNRLMRRSDGGAGWRRPPLRLVTAGPGGPGQSSAGTMTGCLRWLDDGAMRGGGSRPDAGCASRLRLTEARRRGQKSRLWSAAGRVCPKAPDARRAAEARRTWLAPRGAPRPSSATPVAGGFSKIRRGRPRAETITHTRR